MQRHSHYEVAFRNDSWVVIEVFGTAERVVFVAYSEREAEQKCEEYNTEVIFPIA